MTNHPHHTSSHPHSSGSSQLRVVAWETTRACTLACPHCRASAVTERDNDELTTEEAKKMFADIAKIGKCLIILSGGEPLLRTDLEELAKAAITHGHRPVVSCNDGSLLTNERLDSLKNAGITHFSFSMHAIGELEHDNFVRVPGTYSHAIKAFKRIKEHDMSFQINTTILPTNYDLIPEFKDWVVSLGASAWHLFFIVPTGRAEHETSEIKLEQNKIENVLTYVAKESDDWEIPVKVTCAPQYSRIRAEMGKKPGNRGRSCMAGRGFSFVSYKGEVKPCGYFDLVIGNVRQTSFDKIYSESQALKDMSNANKLTGICGKCKFKIECGGCRARAYAVNKSFLGEDPNCKYTSG